ncbi:hypothetical protein H5410_056984, partial [Solanum commersonii]
FSKIRDAADQSIKLVGIADQLSDSPFGIVHRRLALSLSVIVFCMIRRHGTASLNYSKARRLLLFIDDLIRSFRAQHTGIKGDLQACRLCIPFCQAVSMLCLKHKIHETQVKLKFNRSKRMSQTVL